MRLNRFWIGNYKNLQDVTVDFDQEHWVTVLIGWNGTGKSNVLEALATLFRDLLMQENLAGEKNRPTFPYQLRYECRGQWIQIDADPDREKNAYIIHLPASPDTAELGVTISVAQFFKQADTYLPRYVFGYYSGNSDRLREVFRKYLERYDQDLRAGKDPGLRRLFYALPVHSQFVLLAFILQQDEVVKTFLDQQLGLEEQGGIDSVLFVLKQPPWDRTKDHDLFWGARGIVRKFLDRLYQIALAPLRLSRRVDTTLWNKKRRGFRYLYVKDLASLHDLIGDQTPSKFFRDLESTYVSELIEEVRIRIKLRKNDGSVTFRELSEGEQQLLTVLGLLRFTAEEESLLLLDEPDTHLNPRWGVDYLQYLQQFVGKSGPDRESSHIVLTTHNPLTIAALVRGQVQILQRRPADLTIIANPPQFDPRGMGFAGILTSDMFGLESALDNATIGVIKERNHLLYKELKQEITADEKGRLKEIYDLLASMRFNEVFDDPIFSEYLMLLEEEKAKQHVEFLARDTKRHILASVFRSLEEPQS